MPFYEYQCQECDHRVEALQKMSDDPLVYCPDCNAPSLKRLISAAAFRLKGTGWYETDFKDSKKSSDKSSGQSSAASTDGGSKSESAKPESSSAKPAADSGSASTASASA